MIPAPNARRLAFGSVSFLLSVAFWPGLAGAATSPRWSIAALSLYWLKLWPALFAAWCFLRLDFDAAVHWLTIASCWSLGWSLTEDVVETVIKAFALGVGISGVVAVFQLLGWSPVYQTYPPGGLFLNKNLMGEAACLAAVACFRYRAYGYVALTLFVMALSQSRAAWLAAVATLALAVRPLWSFTAIGAVVIALFYSDTASLHQRLGMWSDALRDLSLLGAGSYGLQTPAWFEANLHNDWLQCVYELGIFGLVPLGAVLVVPSAFTLALVVIGSFGFPLHVPATAALAAVIVGNDLRGSVNEFRSLLCERLAV